jgi:hypothetical protein
MHRRHGGDHEVDLAWLGAAPSSDHQAGDMREPPSGIDSEWQRTEGDFGALKAFGAQRTLDRIGRCVYAKTKLCERHRTYSRGGGENAWLEPTEIDHNRSVEESDRVALSHR